MFVIDGAPDDPDVLARLSRLMFNIERGEKVYGWGPDSGKEPLEGSPEPGLLSIKIPGVTRDARPVTVDYRPSVGFVFYAPSTKYNWLELLAKVQTLMDRFSDDHLCGYVSVELSAHATLLQRGRFYSGSDVLGGGSVSEEVWDPSPKPARFFKMGSRDHSSGADPQSIQGAFTWCLAPISVFTRISRFKRFDQFNAAVASIFINPSEIPMESPEPILKYSPEAFGVEPLPDELELQYEDKTSWILVINRGRFEVIGGTADMRRTLGSWTDPEKAGHPSEDEDHPLTIPNLPRQSNAVALTCGACCAPLWGDVYAVTNDQIAPNHMAVCRWCCGCFPKEVRDTTVKVSSGRTQAEAFKGTRLGPLLEAELEVITTRMGIYAFATLKNGKKLVVTPGCSSGKQKSPPCFTDPEVADRRVSHLQWVDVALVD